MKRHLTCNKCKTPLRYLKGHGMYYCDKCKLAFHGPPLPIKIKPKRAQRKT